MRSLAPWILGATLASVSPPAQAGVFPYAKVTEKLENGLTVMIVPMRSDGLVSVRTAVRTGSRDEYEPGHTGFAHFFEHMMFRGTPRYPEAVYSEHLTRMGAEANAYTSTDVTVYEIDTTAEDLDLVLDLESDRFANLAYDETSFATEAGAVYGEFRKNRTSPYFALEVAMLDKAFVAHTYKHDPIGWEADIKAMPTMYDYSKSFFARYYRPENVILVIAGDVKADEVLAKVKKYYGPWKPGYVPPKVPVEPEQTAPRRADVSYTGRTLPIVSVAWKGSRFDAGDRTWVASMVLAELLFGETSPLYKKLVIDEQVVQFLAASPAADRDPGLWSVTTMVKDPARVDAVIAEIDKTVTAAREAAPDPQRVAAIRSHLKYGFLMRLDTPARVAAELAHTVGVSGDPDVYDKLYATMEQVTPADVQAAAKRYLIDTGRTTVVVTEGK